jgi:hypothetical protein
MAEESEVPSLKSGTSGSGALLFLRIHVRFCSYKCLNDRDMPIHACSMQRNVTVSDGRVKGDEAMKTWQKSRMR